MIEVGYDVEAISDEGEVELDDHGGDPCYETYKYQHLRCRDCDHEEDDRKAWIPRLNVVLGEN